jgi:hypothetical protein
MMRRNKHTVTANEEVWRNYLQVWFNFLSMLLAYICKFKLYWSLLLLFRICYWHYDKQLYNLALIFVVAIHSNFLWDCIRTNHGIFPLFLNICRCLLAYLKKFIPLYFLTKEYHIFWNIQWDCDCMIYFSCISCHSSCI